MSQKCYRAFHADIWQALRMSEEVWTVVQILAWQWIYSDTWRRSYLCILTCSIYKINFQQLTLISKANTLLFFFSPSERCKNCADQCSISHSTQQHANTHPFRHDLCGLQLLFCTVNPSFSRCQDTSFNLLPGCQHNNRWGWFTVVSFNYQPWEPKVFLRVRVAIHFKDNYF